MELLLSRRGRRCGWIFALGLATGIGAHAQATPSASAPAPTAPTVAEAKAPEPDARLLKDYQERQRLGRRLLDGVGKALPELLWLDRLTYSDRAVEIEGRAFKVAFVGTFVENLNGTQGFGEAIARDLRQESGEEPGTFADDEEDATEAAKGEPAPKPYLFALRFEVQEEGPQAGAAPAPAREGELTETLEMLRKSLASPEVKVLAFDPAAPDARSRTFKLQRVAVQVEASGYHALALAFDRMVRFPRLVALQSLTLTPIPAQGDRPQQLAAEMSFEIPLLP